MDGKQVVGAMGTTIVYSVMLLFVAGVPLTLSSAPTVRLVTPPLTMRRYAVGSKIADVMTGSQWAADLGLPDDGLPEVPPDGECAGLEKLNPLTRFQARLLIRTQNMDTKHTASMPASYVFIYQCHGDDTSIVA